MEITCLTRIYRIFNSKDYLHYVKKYIFWNADADANANADAELPMPRFPNDLRNTINIINRKV